MKKLFLAWLDPNSRYWFPIGRLTFNGDLYQFVYTKGAIEAVSKSGFVPLLSFPDLEQVYESTELFPLFSNRLMRHSRPEYKNFVQWLNIPQNSDDPIAILARSGGRKATDNFEVFPCPSVDDNGLYHIHFFVHGLRHLPQCSQARINSFKPNEILWLAHEFQNPYDDKALTLNTEDHHIIGYCPRYLVHDFFEILKDKPHLVKVHVERVNPSPTPLQFRLLCNMTAEWDTSFLMCASAEYQPIVDVDFSVSLQAS
jgi:hypothetical protein